MSDTPETKEGCEEVPCAVQKIVDAVNAVHTVVDLKGLVLCCETDPDALANLPCVVVAGHAFVRAAKAELAEIPTGEEDTEWVLDYGEEEVAADPPAVAEGADGTAEQAEQPDQT